MVALIVSHERPAPTTNYTILTGILTPQTQAN